MALLYRRSVTLFRYRIQAEYLTFFLLPLDLLGIEEYRTARSIG